MLARFTRQSCLNAAFLIATHTPHLLSIHYVAQSALTIKLLHVDPVKAGTHSSIGTMHDFGRRISSTQDIFGAIHKQGRHIMDGPQPALGRQLNRTLPTEQHLLCRPNRKSSLGRLGT